MDEIDLTNTSTSILYAGAGVGSVYAVPFEEVADPTYAGYEAPGVYGTAAGMYAASSLTIMPNDEMGSAV
jgi:hypothetical protein